MASSLPSLRAEGDDGIEARLALLELNAPKFVPRSSSLPQLTGAVGRQVYSEFSSPGNYSFGKARRFMLAASPESSPYTVAVPSLRGGRSVGPSASATAHPMLHKQRSNSETRRGSSSHRHDEGAFGSVRLSSTTEGQPGSERLREALSRSVGRVVDFFRSLELNSDGTISKAEFRRGVARLNLGVAGAEADALFDSWDEKRDGFLDLTEVNTILRRGGVRNAVKKRRGCIRQDELVASPPEPSSKHRQMVELLAANVVRVVDLFYQWDINSDGLISRKEFGRVRAVSCLHLMEPPCVYFL